MQKIIRQTILSIFFLSGFIPSSPAQEVKLLSQAADTLRLLQHSIILEKNDSVKIHLNSKFEALLIETLKFPGAAIFPFDSINRMSRLTSPDKRFRIFNWNVPFQDGSHQYFSVIQIFHYGAQEEKVQNLTDSSKTIQDPEHKILGPDNWYGTLYYKIIPFETTGKGTRYLLLGWHGKDTQVTQKIIEILTIDSTSRIIFGAPLFKHFADGKNTRVIFSFSASASMALKYEDQDITTSPKWNQKKRQFESETRNARMVVCDHLNPIDPNLSGQFQFYIPASDQTDGFIYENGNWVFISGVDARNKP